MARHARRRSEADGRPTDEEGARVGRFDSLSPAAEGRLQKKERCVSGITLDAGGLIALDRADRRVLTLLARVTERGMRITIPTTALAQAIRNPSRQARLCRLVRQASTDLIALDGPDATATGLLLARARTADVVDAHVVVCARRAGQPVVTSDPGDLKRLAPELQFVVV